MDIFFEKLIALCKLRASQIILRKTAKIWGLIGWLKSTCEFRWGEIINIKPIVDPDRTQTSFCKLSPHIIICLFRKASKAQRVAAFYDWLTLAPKKKVTVGWISNPKLLSTTNNREILTVSNEDTWLWRTDKNPTIFTFINVDSSVRIEQVNLTFLTIWYLKLLHMKGTRQFDQRVKPSIFKHKVFPFEFFLQHLL